MGCHSRGLSAAGGPGDHIPPLTFCGLGGRATSLTHKKKKKKKKKWNKSRKNAENRWTQIDTHIKKIISQWRVIGANIQNRTLLAKALMLSRCHFLMDGNRIPPHILWKISNRMMGFVRGKFSAMSYKTLEAPLVEGGINSPSLITRKYTVDLKFFSDLITGDQTVPWKKWTWMDLKMASSSS